MQTDRHALAQLLLDSPGITIAWADESANPPTIHIGGPEPDKLNHIQAMVHFPDHHILFAPAPLFRPMITTLAPRDTTNACQQCQNEPIQLGTQIQPAVGDWVGTAGCAITYDNPHAAPGHGLLTNWHVIDAGRNKPGALVHQPTRIFPAMARLIRSAAPSPKTINQVDAAIADTLIDGKHTHSRELLHYGQISQRAVRLAVGSTVAKVGRTTQLTRGVVTAVGAAARVSYGNFTAVFADLDVIKSETAPFSAPGDSGSLVISTACRCPAALLFAGGDDITLASPMKHVIDALAISFNQKQPSVRFFHR